MVQINPQAPAIINTQGERVTAGCGDREFAFADDRIGRWGIVHGSGV